MNVSYNSNNDCQESLADLASLVRDRLLQDRSAVNCGTHLTFYCGAEEFSEIVLAALHEAITGMPNDKLFHILISKVRQERRDNNLPVLVDDEIPPGFSAN